MSEANVKTIESRVQNGHVTKNEVVLETALLF